MTQPNYQHYYFWADHPNLEEETLPDYLSIVTKPGQHGRAYELCSNPGAALAAATKGKLSLLVSPNDWKSHLEELGFTNIMYAPPPW
jgi:hypothetical protein